MIDLPPIYTPDLLQEILNNMSDQDKQHLAEIVMIRMSAELYEHIRDQSVLDSKPMGEWIREACVSYALHRIAVRKQWKSYQ